MVILKFNQKRFEGDLKLKLCGKRLCPTESVKYLAVEIDKNLSWQYHVKLIRANIPLNWIEPMLSFSKFFILSFTFRNNLCNLYYFCCSKMFCKDCIILLSETKLLATEKMVATSSLQNLQQSKEFHPKTLRTFIFDHKVASKPFSKMLLLINFWFTQIGLVFPKTNFNFFTQKFAKQKMPFPNAPYIRFSLAESLETIF